VHTFRDYPDNRQEVTSPVQALSLQYSRELYDEHLEASLYSVHAPNADINRRFFIVRSSP